MEEAFNKNFQDSPNEEIKVEFERQGFEGFGQGRRNLDNSASYYSNDSGFKYHKRDQSPVVSPTIEDIKMQDLQRTNELLLKELRTSNDKYFNERLEGKKLKEELEKLKREVSNLKIERPIRSPSAKRSLNDVCKENDTLKKRIEKLEQE